MSPWLPSNGGPKLGFPRVSGDEPSPRQAGYVLVKFSPRERG